MAFVGRSQKDFNIATGRPNVGPGTYEHRGPIIRQNLLQEQNAPFNLGDQRDIDKPVEVVPGPGEYTHEPRFGMNLDINHKAPLNAIFRSDIDRFYVKDPGVPDPGTYNPDLTMKKDQILYEKKILDYLKSKRKQKFCFGISSIPDRVRVLSEDNTPINLTKKKVEKKRKQHTAKGGAWSSQREKKYCNHIKSETSDNLGPGKYQFNVDQVKIFQKKTQHNFMSSTLRSTQEKPGYKANQFMLQKLKNEAMQLAECEEEIYEIETKYIQKDNYIAREHQNPGPGYYHEEKELEKKKMLQSKTKRFIEARCYSSCGPGEYNQTKFNTFYNTTHGKFLEGEKFKVQRKDIPGPGAYQPKNEMSNNLHKQKKQWEYQNSKIKATLAYQPTEDLPGPGQYQNPDYENRLKELDLISGKLQPQFMTTQDRFSTADRMSHYGGQKIMDPGTYDQGHYTLQQKQKDTKLGFSHIPYQRTISNTQKIIKKQIKSEPEEEEVRKNAVGKKKEKINYQNFEKEERFRQLKKYTQRIGPGQYFDTKKNQFDKKTFNVHFINA